MDPLSASSAVIAVVSLAAQMASLIGNIKPFLDNERATTIGLTSLRAEVDSSKRTIEALALDPTFARDVPPVAFLREMDSLRETLQSVHEFAETSTTKKSNLIRMLKNRERISQLSHRLEDHREMLQSLRLATAAATSPSVPDISKFTSIERLDDNQHTTCDIVFVHGLNGDPKKTWQWMDIPSSQEVLWPRDFLPHGLPSARVYTYGYDYYKIRKTQSDSTVAIAEDLLRTLYAERKDNPDDRPIIWVAHSVGGLIVKSALVHAWKHRLSEEASASVFNGTVGVAFLATPHRASTLLAWKNTLSTIAEIAYPTELENIKHARDLSTDERETLFATTRDFTRFLGEKPIAIHSFFEEDEINTQLGPLRITDFDSAIGSTQETLAYLKGNHLTLCKFQDPSESGYLRIETLLRDWSEDTTVEQIAAGIALGDRPPTQPSNWGNSNLEHMSEIATDVDSLDLSLNRLRQQRRLFQEVLNVSWMERKILPTRQAGSCRWILDSPHYRSWKQPGGKQLLHLTGPPGCGKSILTNFVIDELQKDMKASAMDGNSTVVIYFFFELKQRVDFGFHDLLRIFISQLLDLKPHYMRYVPREMVPKQGRTKEERVQLSPSDELEELLQILFLMLRDPSCSAIFCVIDGLDECDAKSANWIVRFLDQVFQISGVKVLVTSVPFSQSRSPYKLEISSGLTSNLIKWTQTYGGDASFNIASTEGFKHDFVQLVKPRLKNLILNRGLVPRLQKELDEAVLRRSDYGYVWATLVLQIVETKPSIGSVNKFLEQVISYPPDLFAIYENICMTIWRRRGFSDSVEEFGPPIFKILYFLRYALRPLTLEELAITLSVREDSQSIDEILNNKPLGLEKYLRQELGNLLRFESGIVSFINSSFKRFIDERGLPDESLELAYRSKTSWEYKPSEKQTHLDMAKACLKFLCLVHARPSLKADRPARRQDRRPFVEYAKLCWASHLRYAGQSGKEVDGLLRQLWSLGQDARKLFRPALPNETQAGKHHSFSFMSVLVHLDLPYSLSAAATEQKTMPLDQLKDLLRYASMCCSDAMVDSINILIGQREEEEDLSLSMTANLKMSSVLQMLRNDSTVDDVLDSIEQIDELSQQVEVVSAAIKWKPEAFVTDLLHKFLADENSKVWQDVALLEEAAKVQGVETIKLLLDSYEYNDHGFSLHYAAQRGNLDVCKLLLDSGSDCNKINDDGQTPVYVAVVAGQSHVVDFLAQFGANVTTVDTNGRQPLHRAAAGGYIGILELLLDTGARVDLIDKRGRTALFAACTSGMVDTAQQLIHYGADISLQDNQKATPLHASVLAGAEDIVKVLLANGSDPNIRNARGVSPLHDAAWGGSYQIAEALVLAGANVNALDDRRRTPLHYACMSKLCPEDIVTLLIETGADIDARDQEEKRPLHMAARYSNAAIVTQLSDHSTVVNAPDSAGDTPLHISCASESRSSLSITKALVRSGSDLDKENHDGQTPLSLAKSNKNKWYEQFSDWWRARKLELK